MAGRVLNSLSLLFVIEIVPAGSSIAKCQRGYSWAFIAKAPLASILATQHLVGRGVLDLDFDLGPFKARTCACRSASFSSVLWKLAYKYTQYFKYEMDLKIEYFHEVVLTMRYFVHRGKATSYYCFLRSVFLSVLLGWLPSGRKRGGGRKNERKKGRKEARQVPIFAAVC